MKDEDLQLLLKNAERGNWNSLLAYIASPDVNVELLNNTFIEIEVNVGTTYPINAPPVHLKGQRNVNAIMLAAHLNHVTVLKNLIQLGLDIEIQNSEKETPLVIALLNDSDAAAEQLLIAGAKVNNPFVIRDIIECYRIKMLPLVLSQGAKYNKTTANHGVKPVDL